MTDEQRSQLDEMSRSFSLAHRKVVQACALLLAGEGVANEEIARHCGTTPDSVRSWRRRFAEQGVAGVGMVAPGRGRKSWWPEGTVAEVARVTQQEVPEDGSTHWTTRLLAERFGIGKDSVARIWRNQNPAVFSRALVDLAESRLARRPSGKHGWPAAPSGTRTG